VRFYVFQKKTVASCGRRSKNFWPSLISFDFAVTSPTLPRKRYLANINALKYYTRQSIDGYIFFFLASRLLVLNVLIKYVESKLWNNILFETKKKINIP